MKNSSYFFNNVICLFLFLIYSGNTFAQEDSSTKIGPLSHFSQLIGGEWYLDNSYQTFEWGVGNLSVKAKSYFLEDGQARLVSEGAWFWHPELKVIKGYFTAVDMPYSFFEYTTKFEGNKMINELTTYSIKGESNTYQEIWEIQNDNNFQWSLYTKTEAGVTKIMSGKYIRE